MKNRRDNFTTVKPWLLIIGVGMMVTVAMSGVAAFSTPDALPLQRVTPSPISTPSLPTPLRILPLPTIELTPTLTLTTTLVQTPTRTPAVTPIRTPTPTFSPLEGDDLDDVDNGLEIVDFIASPLRLRGQIQLTWRYVGEPFEGNFLVERSVNGGVWRVVSSCNLPYESDAERYRCLETGLASGSTYAYRICVVESETTCADRGFVESAAVKAP
ncbi:MAG: hypothetical protein NZ553_03855 [Caldilinea sp.]|nr:hypothetical protein [Caldilinea sp.]MDW8439587.1 hypothetical protein [Caldilineaceae bacterium]